MKNRLTAMLSTVFVALLLIGCGTTRLEPGGAYAPVDTNGVPVVAPDFELFVVDSAYKIAHSTADLVFSIELANESALWQISPEIKHSLDRIRPKAWEANLEFHKARESYLLHPTQAGLDTMRNVLAKMQQLADVAQAVIPKKGL